MPKAKLPFRYWSASAHGFFAPDHPAIPDDAVEVTDARHSELMHAQATNGPIWSDAEGNPQAAAPEGEA